MKPRLIQKRIIYNDAQDQIRENIKEYRRIRNEESYRLRVEKERQRLERRSKF